MTILKINKNIVRGIKLLTYFVLLFSVATKLFCIPYINDKFQILDISQFCEAFGAIELISILLFFNEKTLGLGLALLCAYFGGAIATDLRYLEYLYQPMIVFALVLTTALFRKPSIFHSHLQLCTDDSSIIIAFGKQEA